MFSVHFDFLSNKSHSSFPFNHELSLPGGYTIEHYKLIGFDHGGSCYKNPLMRGFNAAFISQTFSEIYSESVLSISMLGMFSINIFPSHQDVAELLFKSVLK